MKVGPKGQVVIPKTLRKALKISPGMNVVFRLEGEKVVLTRPQADIASVFEELAKKGESVRTVAPHLYEEEFVSRV